MVSENSVVKVSSDQVSCDLDGEATILNLSNGQYYGLAEVGGRVWDLMKTPHEVRAIHAALMEEFEVDSAECMSDLLKLLRRLRDEKLIEVT